MQNQVDAVIKQIPEWNQASSLRVERLEGLTNTNYLVTVDGDRFVLRMSGQNTERLGIDRNHEMEPYGSLIGSFPE